MGISVKTKTNLVKSSLILYNAIDILGVRLFKFGQFKLLKKIVTANNKKVMYICQI